MVLLKKRLAFALHLIHNLDKRTSSLATTKNIHRTDSEHVENSEPTQKCHYVQILRANYFYRYIATLEITQAYLANRKMKARIGNHYSDEKPILHSDSNGRKN